MRDLVVLTGPEAAGRLSGTEGARKAAVYLAGELRSAGYQPAGRDSYFDPVNVPAARLLGRPRLALAGRALRHRVEYGEIAALSAGGTATGPLLVTRDGDSVTPGQLPGRVVLILERPADFDLGATAEAAAEFEVGALLVESGEPRWFHKTVYAGGGRLPVLRVRTSLAQALARSAGARVEVELPLQQSTRTCQNVLGLLPGLPTGRTVVLAAHYDHVGDDPGGERFPGALDNAAGVAVLLAVARELASRPEPLPFDLLVAFLTGEESGLWGARQLVGRPPARLHAAINLDGIGSEPDLAAIRTGHARPGDWLAALAGEIFARRGTRVEWTGGRDDSSVFIAAGIPTVGLGQQPSRQGGVALHTPDDSSAAVYPATLAAGAAAIVELINCLGRTPAWLALPESERNLTHG